jgi:hypothetical protein
LRTNQELNQIRTLFVVFVMTVHAKRRWVWIFIPTLLVAFLLADVAQITLPLFRLTGDRMDYESQFLAGLRSVNCGRVRIRGDASRATQCALRANAEGKPFRVIYEVQGYDSIVAGAVVRTQSGRLLFLSYDGMSFLRQRVDVAPCPQPYHLYVNPLGRLNCFHQELTYPQNIGSPNMAPY